MKRSSLNALLMGVSFAAMGSVAYAQQPAPAAAEQSVEEVVVTGSRIVTNGFNAPRR